MSPKMVELEGWKQIKPRRIVCCTRKDCAAAAICRHAVDHVERINCYNDRPEERTTDYGHPYVVCPECQPVEVKNNGS